MTGAEKTHSWQCVFELSKGAQCHDETASCLLFIRRKKQGEPWTCIYQNPHFGAVLM